MNEMEKDSRLSPKSPTYRPQSLSFTSKPSPKPLPQQHPSKNSVTPTTYLSETLLALDQAGFKAAGVLPYYDQDGQRWVLMGEEIRDGKEQLCFLAGKRDLSDRDAEHTAARELWEESGQILDLASVYFQLRTKPGVEVLWIHSGKLALFLLDVGSSPAFRSLPDIYRLLPSRPPDADMLSLHWLTTKALVSGLKDRSLTLDQRSVRIWDFANAALRAAPLAAFLSWPDAPFPLTPPSTPPSSGYLTPPPSPYSTSAPSTPTAGLAGPPKAPGSPPVRSECRDGIRCKRTDSAHVERFFHPTQSAREVPERNVPAGPVANDDVPSTPLCKFGLKCWNTKCTRTHPAGWDPTVARGAGKEKKARGGASTLTWPELIDSVDSLH